MKIYLSRIEYKSFPWIIWKDQGRLLSILHGVNQEGCKIEPVYLPLLRYSFWPGMMTFQTPKTLVMLMARKPWIFVQKAEGIRMENE